MSSPTSKPSPAPGGTSAAVKNRAHTNYIRLDAIINRERKSLAQTAMISQSFGVNAAVHCERVDCLPKVNRENRCRDRDSGARKTRNRRADRPAPPAGSQLSRSPPADVSLRFFPVDKVRLSRFDPSFALT